MERLSGILLPISSLPSDYGIGCFDEYSYKFVDFLADSAQSYWQILPIGPTSFGDSPYQSFSSFAGNPYFISLKELINQGLLTEEELICHEDNTNKIDYEKLYNTRYNILKTAFSRWEKDAEYEDFAEKNEYWLSDYSLFMALKEHFSQKVWNEWPDDIKLRKPQAICEYSNLLKEEIEFHCFLQFEFITQWMKLKEYANNKRVEIIGDIPIYVSFDSADAWANPELFCLDEDLNPTSVAGCPPDGFSADGQLWGNPLYDWKMHKKTNYQWWIERIKYSFTLFDLVRIDHFRGFDEYYSIPYGDKTAVNGKWEKGPGKEFFAFLKCTLSNTRFIAEDLGFLTDGVRDLLEFCGYPGMKVLQFGFDSRDSSSNDHIPHNYKNNYVVYTGTHDNHTLLSWLHSISQYELDFVAEYFNTCTNDPKDIADTMIFSAFASVCDTCIIPFADWLGLDDSARINIPSTLGDNWVWRAKKSDFSDELKEKIAKTTRLYARCKH